MLICAIVAGLVVGKSVGIVSAAWIAVKSGIAIKPDAILREPHMMRCRRLGGIGFTMSLFIAGAAFPDATSYARRAKIAIFLASLLVVSVRDPVAKT